MSISRRFRDKIKSIKESYTGKGGLYSHVPVDFSDMLKVQSKLQQYLPDVKMDSIQEGHITIIYSKTDHIPFTTAIQLAQPEESDYPYECILSELIFFDNKEDGTRTLVIKVDEPCIVNELHDKWIQAGYEITHPSYIPHLTVEYDSKYTDQDLIGINSYLAQKPILISVGSEVIEDLRED